MPHNQVTSVTMERYNNDKEQLLKEAMLYEGVTMRCLKQALEMEEHEIISRLYGNDAQGHIRRVCKVLNIDSGYFSGSMRYVNGKLTYKSI